LSHGGDAQNRAPPASVFLPRTLLSKLEHTIRIFFNVSDSQKSIDAQLMGVVAWSKVFRQLW
jgi:hypothetical protein